MPGTTISFAGNSLQTTNILTADIAHEQWPVRDVKMYAIAHANMSKIPYTSFPSKSVVVRGKVIDTTIAALDSRLDTFRSYFLSQDQNLDIGYGGSTRRYIATANTVAIDRPGGLSYANFSIEFYVTEPFGRETSTTSALTAAGRTLASYSDPYTFLGTAPIQQPIVTVTLTAVSGATNKTITIGNAGSGQQITITRTWTAADILIVDSTLKKVTVNGTEVDFSGAFPEFAPGSQTITYNDDFTSRTFTYGITYYKRYI